MNRITKDIASWRFPEHINFEDVSEIVNTFKDIDITGQIIFDLSDTINFHSSFIGFLIHTKHTLKQNGGNLILLLSFTAERLLVMLNLLDYFSPEILSVVSKKSA